MQELQKFNASKQSHKPTCYPLLLSIWKTFCGIPTINKKNVISLLKTFPMKTPPLLLWSWLGVVSMVKALKVGLKGPSMWPFLSQAMPFHWFWSCCSTSECYKGTVYKDSKLLASFLKRYIGILPGWFGAKIKCTVHVALRPKPGFSIGNRNQGPISVSLSKSKFFFSVLNFSHVSHFFLGDMSF